MKILAFTFMYMIYRMMSSKEFKIYFDRQTEDLNSTSIKLGLLKAKLFNDDLIEKHLTYEAKRAKFADELQKLESKLKTIKYENKHEDTKHKRRESSANVFQLKKDEGSEKSSTKAYVDKVLVGLVDKVLFRSFIGDLFKRNLKQHTLSDVDIEIQLTLQKRYRRKTLEAIKTDEDDINLQDKSSAIKNYNLTIKDYFNLVFIYLPASNSQNIVFVMCLVNHYNYASLESILLPLSVIGYALLENPRPPSTYFKVLIYYTSFVVFAKFVFQLDLWPYITGGVFPNEYHDMYKLGFNLAQNTYSEIFFWYIFWDALLMIIILFHFYYLRRVGLLTHAEYDIENYEQAKARYIKESTHGVFNIKDS